MFSNFKHGDLLSHKLLFIFYICEYSIEWLFCVCDFVYSQTGIVLFAHGPGLALATPGHHLWGTDAPSIPANITL